MALNKEGCEFKKKKLSSEASYIYSLIERLEDICMIQDICGDLHIGRLWQSKTNND